MEGEKQIVVRQARGRKNRRGRKPRQSRQSIMEALAYEGAEQIRVFSGVPKIPKPIHTQFKTRQMVGLFNSSTAVAGSSGVFGPTISQTGATAVYGQLAFELQDLDQVSSFTSLFDQYRIDKVHVIFRTRNPGTFVANTSTANQGIPSVLVVIDRDDATVLTSLAAAREYDNVTEFSAEQSCSVMLEPSVTPAMYAVGSFSGYAVARTGIWLDAANTNIPHYGLKFVITALNSSTTSSWFWDIECYYYLSFRNVR